MLWLLFGVVVRCCWVLLGVLGVLGGLAGLFYFVLFCSVRVVLARLGSVVRLFGCSGVRLFGCLVVSLVGCLVGRLFGCWCVVVCCCVWLLVCCWCVVVVVLVVVVQRHRRVCVCPRHLRMNWQGLNSEEEAEKCRTKQRKCRKLSKNGALVEIMSRFHRASRAKRNCNPKHRLWNASRFVFTTS